NFFFCREKSLTSLQERVILKVSFDVLSTERRRTAMHCAAVTGSYGYYYFTPARYFGGFYYGASKSQAVRV
ncbi:MAG: hypothetical protein LUE95_05885, partial [Oscillospiraceae bacterium]|nr:hypothetical protein [Oscillospiraceae bacterium]